jgi:hypothetical protein
MTMVGADETGVCVEELNDAERRVYDLASTATPLAEVAVRLGVSIGEAERRIGMLLARLGLPDRAALRALASGEVASRVPVDAGAGADEAAGPAMPTRRRKRPSMLRRATLVLPLLLLLGVAAGAVYELRPGDGDGVAHPGGVADAAAGSLHGS